MAPFTTFKVVVVILQLANSIVDLQNLLCATLVLRVVFNLKTKQTSLSRLHSRVGWADSQRANKDSDAESSLSPASPPVVPNIACYNLAQDKIIYICDVQRRWLAIKAKQERKKRLAIVAALAALHSTPATIWWFVKLVGLLMIKTYWLNLVSRVFQLLSY